jgi:5'-nucleotidase
MNILISNDDGIYSPGIAALAEVASEFGTVRLVAPDVERSSASHAITSSRPLSYRRTSIGSFTAYRVNGTPADCAALGIELWGHVDLVLSGLNIGLNLGNSIWHSGTVAAAKQAALLGRRGIAFSAPSNAEPDFTPFKPWIRQALEVVLGETALTLINVNVPMHPRGLVWTRASVRHYDGRIVPTKDPMGRELYWFTVVPIEETEPWTDRWALEQGWTSLTPLRLDPTDDTWLADVRARHPLDEARAAQLSEVRSSPDRALSVRENEAKPVAESFQSEEA